VPQNGAGPGRQVERFHPTSGRLLGSVAVVIAAAAVLIGVLDRDQGYPMPVVFAAVFFGVLAWAAMLRPRVSVTDDELVLRNMLETVHVPLAAIEQVAVRQVLAVSAGEQRYLSTAVGRSRRQAMKSNRRDAASQGPTESYAVFVEERITRLADDARARRGIGRLSDEQLELASDVRRDRAWPEIVVLVASALAFVVSLFV